MKKFLPLIFFLIGLIALVAIIFVIKGRNSSSPSDSGEMVVEIPDEKKPVVSLIPSVDGHWLKLKIEEVKVEAESLDYELLYKLPDGRTQGVPGTVTLDNRKSFERDLLLGSESSGKYRYDEGVSQGTLTLRFRNDKGKLLGKLSTEFRLLTGDGILKSADENFSYELSKPDETVYFIIMETFGIPDSLENITAGPYGIFSAENNSKFYPGSVKLSDKVLFWNNGKWENLSDFKSENIGIFVGTSI